MAKEVAATTNGETAPRKRRAPEGPRKIKPINVLFTVTDSSGAVVPNVHLNMIASSKDLEDIFDKKTDDTILVRVPLGPAA